MYIANKCIPRHYQIKSQRYKRLEQHNKDLVSLSYFRKMWKSTWTSSFISLYHSKVTLTVTIFHSFRMKREYNVTILVISKKVAYINFHYISLMIQNLIVRSQNLKLKIMITNDTLVIKCFEIHTLRNTYTLIS